MSTWQPTDLILTLRALDAVNAAIVILWQYKKLLMAGVGFAVLVAIWRNMGSPRMIGEVAWRFAGAMLVASALFGPAMTLTLAEPIQVGTFERVPAVRSAAVPPGVWWGLSMTNFVASLPTRALRSRQLNEATKIRAQLAGVSAEIPSEGAARAIQGWLLCYRFAETAVINAGGAGICVYCPEMVERYKQNGDCYQRYTALREIAASELVRDAGGQENLKKLWGDKTSEAAEVLLANWVVQTDESASAAAAGRALRVETGITGWFNRTMAGGMKALGSPFAYLAATTIADTMPAIYGLSVAGLILAGPTVVVMALVFWSWGALAGYARALISVQAWPAGFLFVDSMAGAMRDGSNVWSNPAGWTGTTLQTIYLVAAGYVSVPIIATLLAGTLGGGGGAVKNVKDAAKGGG